MQLSQAFHGACEAESALKAPSRGQEQQCATVVQAIVFIFPCDWWCVGTLRAVHKTGRLSATFCAVATRTPIDRQARNAGSGVVSAQAWRKIPARLSPEAIVLRSSR